MVGLLRPDVVDGDMVPACSIQECCEPSICRKLSFAKFLVSIVAGLAVCQHFSCEIRLDDVPTEEINGCSNSKSLYLTWEPVGLGEI